MTFNQFWVLKSDSRAADKYEKLVEVVETGRYFYSWARQVAEDMKTITGWFKEKKTKVFKTTKVGRFNILVLPYLFI